MKEGIGLSIRGACVSSLRGESFQSMSIINQSPSASGLEHLEAAIRRDLERLDYPKRSWVIPRQTADGQEILNVLIIGGGQCGLSAAFGLMREKIDRILVIDENPQRYEGPWLTFARMLTLRTPKYLSGPDLGIPNLTPHAWYEARFGEEAWENLHLLPKELWAEYLQWYRATLQIPVRNQVQAGAIEWVESEQCFRVPIQDLSRLDAPLETLFARKVVMATGIEGSGQWDIPKMVQENLPRELYAHTRHDIDFEGLKGKRIGILGAGASAFDNASVALETGAKEVRLFFRRKKLPTVNPYRWAEFVGFLKHHYDLPDADRWRSILQILKMGQLPPADTFDRAKRYDGFHLHGGTPWEKVEAANGGVKVTTSNGTFDFDFLIIGTGFITDLSLRPELANLHSKIALWSDRYTPPEAERHSDLARHPYLGASFEFQEKTPGAAPYLSGLFNYTFGGLASLGFGGGSISGLKYSVPRLVSGLTRQLYFDDKDLFYQSLLDYDIQEFFYDA